MDDSQALEMIWHSQPSTSLLRLAGSSTNRLALAALTYLLLGVNAWSQYGASPSQTGTFFDDFRSRQRKGSAIMDAGAKDGDVTYDYSSGVYRDKEKSQISPYIADLEASREISRPSVRSGSNAFAARSVGDYTNYSGQYSTPSSFFAPTYTSDPFLSGKRNLKLGPVNLGFGFYQGLEYNDNIARSSDATENKLTDFISSSMLSIDANYQITNNNRLTLTTGIGMDRYLNHPEIAKNLTYGPRGFVLNVLPGTTMAFDIKAGPVYLTLYNRFSVRPTVRNDSQLYMTSMFGVIQNDTGIAANWRINSAWSLSANVMHSYTEAISSTPDASGKPVKLDEYNRSMDTVHASLSFSPYATWSAGVEGGSSLANYKSQFNNDGLLNNAGLFLVLPLGKTTYARLAGGAQIFNYDTPSSFEVFDGSNESAPNFLAPGQVKAATPAQIGSSNGDFTDLSDFYYNLTFTNRLNSRLSHSLSVGHESSLNLITNFVTADYVNYGISTVAWKGSRISLSTYLENASTSAGKYAQDFLQYGTDLYLSHKLNSKVNLGAGYHFGLTEADYVGSVPDTDYNAPDGQTYNQREQFRDRFTSHFIQHAFNFDISYTLSKKAMLILGYRLYNNQMDLGSGNDYKQNRFVTGFNYNF